jgi:hypothetical protein
MIADPMADLTGQGTPGTGGDNLNSQKEVFNPLLLQVNMQRIDRIRSIMGIASGCVAGILGATGLQGLGKITLIWGYETILGAAIKRLFFAQQMKSFISMPQFASSLFISLYRFLFGRGKWTLSCPHTRNSLGSNI